MLADGSGLEGPLDPPGSCTAGLRTGRARPPPGPDRPAGQDRGWRPDIPATDDRNETMNEAGRIGVVVPRDVSTPDRGRPQRWPEPHVRGSGSRLLATLIARMATGVVAARSSRLKARPCTSGTRSTAKGQGLVAGDRHVRPIEPEGLREQPGVTRQAERGGSHEHGRERYLSGDDKAQANPTTAVRWRVRTERLLRCPTERRQPTDDCGSERDDHRTSGPPARPAGSRRAAIAQSPTGCGRRCASRPSASATTPTTSRCPEETRTSPA